MWWNTRSLDRSMVPRMVRQSNLTPPPKFRSQRAKASRDQQVRKVPLMHPNTILKRHQPGLKEMNRLSVRQHRCLLRVNFSLNQSLQLNNYTLQPIVLRLGPTMRVLGKTL